MVELRTSSTLLRVIGSDPQSVRWTEFVEKYESFMIGCVREHYPNIADDDLDDVLQNIMIAVMKFLPNYQYAPDEKGHFSTYLHGVCKYKAYELARKRKRMDNRVELRSDVEVLQNADGDDVQATDVAKMLVEEWRGQESEYMQWQRSALEIALRQLMSDPKIRQQNKEIFRLLAITGEKSPDDVAKMFNLTRNNVDQIKNRMLGKLRTLAHKLKHLDSSAGE